MKDIPEKDYPRVYYHARLAWGQPNVTELIVSRETDKSIWIESKTDLLGNSFGVRANGSRHNRRKFNLHDTFVEAIEAVYKSAESNVGAAEAALQEAKDVRSATSTLLMLAKSEEAKDGNKDSRTETEKSDG